MLRIVLLFVTLAFAAAQNQPWSYSTCSFGTGSNTATINDFYVESPIVHPGSTKFRLDAYNSVNVDSIVNGSVTMRRTVSGLTANVVCTLLTIEPGLSVSIGTCTYPDLCDLVYTLMGVLNDKDNCPDYLVDEGLDCTCPWQIPAGKDLYLEDVIDVTDLCQFNVSWLVVGDFNINVKATHRGRPLVCMDIKTSTKPATSTCPPPGKK